MSVEIIAVDYVLIAAYFLGLLAIGLYYMFTKKDTPASYFLADRDANWFQIGSAYYASHLGVETMVALTGAGATVGISAAYFDWLSAILFLVLAFVFSQFFFKTRVFSTPEYMEKRFNRQCRVYLSSLSLVTYALTRIAMALFATAVVLEDLLGWNFWASIISLLATCSLFITMGGMSALFASEVVQTFCILTFGVLFFVSAMSASHGMENLKSSLPDRFFHVWHSDGHYPWSGLLFGYPVVGFWYYVTDQEIIQRGLAGRTIPDIQGGCILAAFLKLVAPFMFILPGMVARSLYAAELQCDDAQATTCGRTDSALTLIAERHLPRGTIGIMAVAILAALMSSIASVFNSIATLATMDLYFVIKGTSDIPDSRVVLVGRIAVVSMTIFALIFVPFVYHLSSSLLVAMQTIDACVGPPITVVFVVSVLSSRISSTGVFVGLICGHIAGMVRFCSVIFSGEATESTELNFLHFALIEAGITLVVVLIVSFLFPPKYEEMKAAVPLTWAGRHLEWKELVSDEKKALRFRDKATQLSRVGDAENDPGSKLEMTLNGIEEIPVTPATTKEREDEKAKITANYESSSASGFTSSIAEATATPPPPVDEDSLKFLSRVNVVMSVVLVGCVMALLGYYW